ncbi:pimeloyl-ACP methyl ester carboxylesterase [Curtobacterium sp. PvP017]
MCPTSSGRKTDRRPEAAAQTKGRRIGTSRSRREGTDVSVFDGFRQAPAANRAEFFQAVASGPFSGFNRDGVTPSEPVIANWWRQGMTGSAVAHDEGIEALSETDQTEDLCAITGPVLVLQGDDDRVVPDADGVAHRAPVRSRGRQRCRGARAPGA